jgi:hypothetical protein
MEEEEAWPKLRTQRWARSRNAPCRTRTCDRRIRNPLLYPAELRAQFEVSFGWLLCPREKRRQGDLQLGDDEDL